MINNWPSTKNPFGKFARFSPLDTRRKKYSQDLRVILNLSHPFESGSMIHSISKQSYLGDSMEVHYPTVDDLVKIIQRKGRRAKILKWDLRKAYHQMYMSLGSIHLLGYVVDNLMYFNVTLLMGSRLAAYWCQCTTNTVIYIYK